MPCRLLHITVLFGGTVGPLVMGALFMWLFLFTIGVQQLFVMGEIGEFLFGVVAKGVGLLIGGFFLLVYGCVLEKEVISLG